MIPKVGLFRSLLYSSANVYTEYVLALVVSVVIARSLGPAEFGVYTLLIWICSLSVTAINSGIGVAAIKFTSELAGRGQSSVLPVVQRYLAKLQLLRGGIFAIVFALIAFFYPVILVSEAQWFFILLLIPAVVLKSYHMFQIGILKGHQDFRALARIAFIVAPLNVLFVGIAYFMAANVLGYLIAFLLTSLVFVLASSSSLRMLPTEHEPSSAATIDGDLKDRIRRLVVYTSVIVILGSIVSGQSELLFLKHLGNSSEIAFFGVGFVLAGAATALVPGVYNNILLPRISYALGQDEQTAGVSAVLTSTRHMLYLSLFCAVPVIVFAKDFVLLFYGEDYRAAYVPTATFALIAVAASIRNVTSAYLVSVEAQHLILKMVIAAFVGTLVLDVWLILEYGLLGAVIAYAVVDIIMTIAISYTAYRRLGHWPNFTKMTRALLAAVVSAGCGYVIGSALGFPGGFMIGAAVCPVVFTICLFLFDAFDVDDYKSIQPIVSGRSDLFCRVVDTMVKRRLATQ